MRIGYLSILLTLLLSVSIPISAEELRSPNGRIAVQFSLADVEGLHQAPVYTVLHEGKELIGDSRLGLDLGGSKHDLIEEFTLLGVERRSNDTTWRPVIGERSEIRDHYNEMLVRLAKDDQRLNIVFRAYDEGVAFCYNFPKENGGKKIRISRELTHFRFTGGWRGRPTGYYMAHETYAAQDLYGRVPLSRLRDQCERPLTIEVLNGPIVSITEARLVDYARMRLGLAKNEANAKRNQTVISQLSGMVTFTPPYTTPWRVIMIADTPAKLLEQNYLILNLNDPCAIEDPSWIKPGNVFYDPITSTKTGKEAVDFALARGMQYIIFDAGWYGYERDPNTDATTYPDVGLGWTPGPPTAAELARGKPWDLLDVIKYAKAKDIGVLLYVNHMHLEKQLDDICETYEKWGISGIKFGFVNVGSQEWTTWLHDAIRKCADHHLVVNVHDEYRPTGYRRTYPNLLTCEGILSEYDPPSDQRLTQVFTRLLCGPADGGIYYYSSVAANSRAHHVAHSVVYFNPLRFIYWGTTPDRYQGEPGTKLLDVVPAVWDETRVLDGAIGQHVTVARRHGAEWYVGIMNARVPYARKLALDFLQPDTQYTANIYEDDTGTPDLADDRERVVTVDDNTVLDVVIPSNGGTTIRLLPKE